VSLVERELLALPEHLSSPPVFSGVRVTRYLVLYVCFVARIITVIIHMTTSVSRIITVIIHMTTSVSRIITVIIHMTTSVSRKINVVCINFKMFVTQK
jgi:hypothetical protein